MGQRIPITNFIKTVNKKYPLEFAVLFGSRAGNNELKSSDYDILLVSKHFPKDIFLRMSNVLDVWREKGALEPVCFTPSEFETALGGYNTIVWECLKTGRVLYGEKKFRKYRLMFDNAVKTGAIDITRTVRFLKGPEAIISGVLA